MVAPFAALSRRQVLRTTAVGLVGCPAILRAQSQRRLRLAHALPRSHPVQSAIERFVALVHERTGGEVAIDVFSDGELGQEAQLFEQAKLGRLDFVKTSASVLERASPAFQVLSLPFVLRDRDHWARVTSGPIGGTILATLAPSALVGLTFYDAGSRSFYGQTPIDHPDVLRGLRIRVQPSPTMVQLVRLFGAEPVQLPWDQTFDALATRLVDGAENSVVALVVGRHAEVVKFYSSDEHTMVPDVLMASTRCWDGLTPKQRETVRNAATDSSRHMDGLWSAFAADARRKVEAMGVRFTSPDKAAFAERAASLSARLADATVADLVNQIKAV